MSRYGRYVAITDQAVSSISNFVTVAIVAQVSTATVFGQFSLAYAGLLLILGAQRSLVGETLLVRYSGADALDSGVRRNALGVSVAVATVTAPLLAVGGIAGGGQYGKIWLFMAAALPLVLVQDLLRYLFICTGRPAWALLLDMLWAVLSVAAMLLLLVVGAEATAMVAAWGAGALISIAVGLALAPAMPRPGRGLCWLLAERDLSFRYLGEFAALNASTFVVLYLLAFPLGAVGVGALRAAQLLFSPLNTAFAAIKMAVIPDLVRTRGTPIFRTRLIETAGIVGGLAALWGVIVLLLPGVTGRMILGDTWITAAELRWPYLVQYAAMVPYTVLLAYLRATVDNRSSTKMRALLAVLTLVLPVTGAFLWSTSGAAWGFTVAMALATTAGLGLAVAGRRRTRVSHRDDVRPVSVTE